MDSGERIEVATAGATPRRWGAILAAAVLEVGILGFGAAQASNLPVPNGSFEAPVTDFASPDTASWWKAPPPSWYNDPLFPWDQLAGQFRNTTNGSPDHIDNMEGDQAAFLFALPDVAMFQDYSTLTGTNGWASHPFNAQFDTDKAYTLTVGVIGGGGGMTNGATLEIALYFRDAANHMVTVGATTITYSQALFPTRTNFIDFQVRIPFVKATDDWAGKRIGIRIASTVGFDLRGGFWDVDNVRLSESVVPNGSFELPGTDFADPALDAWQKAPKPPWYDETGGFLWNQLTGQYLNPPLGATNRVPNMEGDHAAWLFAVPQVAIYQDYDSVGGTNTAPTHEFDRRFEPGKSYALTVGVLGGGGGMSGGATLELSLYYRDAGGTPVPVAATTVTNTPAFFGTNQKFIDFQVNVPTVKVTDAWAGRHIGVQLASTVGVDQMGGFWDVDNVRLVDSLLANSSFELPETDFAHPAMDGWHKAPKPDWYDESDGFLWDQLMGQFLNPAPGATNRIDNMDGKQAAWLFAVPGVAIFQDRLSFGGTNAPPPDDFGARYERGKSYALTVGVSGGGGGMSDGATLELSFYYPDAASNRITVASTTITHSPALFPADRRHFTDFSVLVPPVTGGEAWAGRPIGVQIASTVGFDKNGGFWDVDNVRLRVVEDPVLKNPQAAGGQFQFILQSAPGRYVVLASTNLALPSAYWDTVRAVTNLNGNLPVTDPNAGHGERFYQVRPLP
jgi:hypothetical protein